MNLNYQLAIDWISMRLQRPTIKIVIECETYLDLNFSLQVLQNRIIQNNGCSLSSFRHTRKIKHYLEKLNL